MRDSKMPLKARVFMIAPGWPVWFLIAASAFFQGTCFSAIGSPFPTDPLKAAYEGDLTAIRDLLAKGADIDARDERGFTMLTYAVSGQQVKTVQFLLAMGASPMADGGAAICAASSFSDPTLLYWLISAGADINSHCSGDLATPLIHACQEDSLSKVTFLLSLGAQVNVENVFGWTPLMLAAQNDADLVALLLSKGANVNQQDKAGKTALMYACMRGRADIVKLLAGVGADEKLTDKEGLTAEQHAARQGFNFIVRLLKAPVSGTELRRQVFP
jgi:ankyrin repeat protein